jgi:hypothetical protein
MELFSGNKNFEKIQDQNNVLTDQLQASLTSIQILEQRVNLLKNNCANVHNELEHLQKREPLTNLLKGAQE